MFFAYGGFRMNPKEYQHAEFIVMFERTFSSELNEIVRFSAKQMFCRHNGREKLLQPPQIARQVIWKT